MTFRGRVKARLRYGYEAFEWFSTRIPYVLVFVLPYFLLLGVAMSFWQSVLSGSDRSNNSYTILISGIGICATLAGLSLRASSCSRDDGEKEMYRDAGLKLFFAVLLLIWATMSLYCLEAVSRFDVPEALGQAIRIPLAVVAGGLFLEAVAGTAQVFRVLTHFLFLNAYRWGFVDAADSRFGSISYPFKKEGVPEDVPFR